MKWVLDREPGEYSLMKTINRSFFRRAESFIIDRIKSHVPACVGTRALTFFSLLCSGFMLWFYLLSRGNSFYLLPASVFIVGEWICDCLDGAIGRERKEGFVRWGYFMDHLFDFFFAAFLGIGFFLIFPGAAFEIFLFLILISAHMIRAFLYHDALGCNEQGLQVSFMGFSPIEFRIVVILLNISLFLFPLHRDVIFLYVMRVLIVLMSAGIIIVTYCNQKHLMALDKSASGGGDEGD